MYQNYFYENSELKINLSYFITSIFLVPFQSQYLRNI